MVEAGPYFHLTRASLWIAITATVAALPDSTRRDRWVAGALLASTFIQFLAAPVLWDRLFVVQQLLVATILLERIERQTPNRLVRNDS